MSTLLCSECFRDEGLRIEAEQLGSLDDKKCLRCDSSSGYKLVQEQVTQLFNDFFVQGSVPRNIGSHAPVYKASTDPAMETVSFPGHLQSDYDIFKESLGVVLFRYGPSSRILGETEQYHALSEALEQPTQSAQVASAQPVLDEIIKQCSETTLPAGTTLYRIRTNVQSDHYSPSAYDTVPDRYKTEETCSRFDTLTLPIFYAARDVETCLHECRVTAADEIYLATMRTTQDLRLLDIGEFNEADEDATSQSVRITMNKLCTTNKDEYPTCRLVSQAIKDAGYDGFKFKSYYSIVKDEPLFNYAIFGHPVASEVLTLESVNRIVLKQVDYDYSFGPLLESK